MLKRFEKTISAEHLIESGGQVLCAVSGGADSVALLVLLKQLSDRVPFVLHAAHLDHCLRSESGEDARFVEELCASLQIPLTVESVDVRRLSTERGEGLEAAGRFARRRFLERLAEEKGCSRIALGHHADDQAETVLFRLLRGSGLTGLAAMQFRSGMYIRPLLQVRKWELCDWLTENAMSWREDDSNRDPAFSRNLIRNQVLPELLRLNPQADEALCRFSRQVALEENYWSAQVDVYLDQHLIQNQTEDGLSLAIGRLQAVHPALRRRILRGMIERMRGDLRQIDAGHIDQIDALLEGLKPQVEACVPGVWVARRYDILQMRLTPPEIESFELTIPGEGVYTLPGGDSLVVELQPASSSGPYVTQFCAEQVPFPLTVRSVRPGDRFQPSGMMGHKRLKNYFIDNKMSREVRRQTPVVCSAATIIWLVGERRCEGFRPEFGGKVLQLRFKRAVFVDE